MTGVPRFAILVVAAAALLAPTVAMLFANSLNPIGWLVLIATAVMAA
jgi:hypothetical protein